LHSKVTLLHWGFQLTRDRKLKAVDQKAILSCPSLNEKSTLCDPGRGEMKSRSQKQKEKGNRTNKSEKIKSKNKERGKKRKKIESDSD
jgi:hypothetical protein